MQFNPANRWQAFGWHLLVSLAIFMVLGAIIYFWWYPGILFHYDGGLEGMKLIAGVDFFIGPLLTLLVYQVGKKTLKFDLGCIAMLQVVCIVGGMWVVWQTRPVAVVYANNTFRSISYNVYSDYGVVVSAVPLLEGRWPIWIWAVDGYTGHNLFGEPQRDTRAHLAVDRYLPFTDVLPKLASTGRTADQVTEALRVEAQTLAANNPDLMFYLGSFGAGSGYVAIDTGTGQAVEFLPLIPRDTSLLVYLSKSKVFIVNLINALFQRT